MTGHALLQGIFPTWGLNPGLPYCRQILSCLRHQGSPADNSQIRRFRPEDVVLTKPPRLTHRDTEEGRRGSLGLKVFKEVDKYGHAVWASLVQVGMRAQLLLQNPSSYSGFGLFIFRSDSKG